MYVLNEWCDIVSMWEIDHDLSVLTQQLYKMTWDTCKVPIQIFDQYVVQKRSIIIKYTQRKSSWYLKNRFMKCMNLLQSGYRRTSNISHILTGNNIVDHSDLVWVWPIGATSSFST